MKKILVPVDFSDVTQDVIEHVIGLAKAFDGTVCLLHVAPPEPEFVGYKPGPQTVRDHVAHEIHEEQHNLEQLELQLKGAGVKTAALLVQGPTIEKILKEMEELSVDLVVMGSHGHGAWHDLIVGSVTEAVLRKAWCPVLVVPSHHKDSA